MSQTLDEMMEAAADTQPQWVGLIQTDLSRTFSHWWVQLLPFSAGR